MSSTYNEKKGFIEVAGPLVRQECITYKNFYVASPEVYGVNIEFVFSKRSVTP